MKHVLTQLISRGTIKSILVIAVLLLIENYPLEAMMQQEEKTSQRRCVPASPAKVPDLSDTPSREELAAECTVKTCPTTSHILQLFPSDIWVENISPRLSFKEILQLSSACKWLRSFKGPMLKGKALDLTKAKYFVFTFKPVFENTLQRHQVDSDLKSLYTRIARRGKSNKEYVSLSNQIKDLKDKQMQLASEETSKNKPAYELAHTAYKENISKAIAHISHLWVISLKLPSFLFSNEDWAHIIKMTHLESLDLHSSSLSDTGWERLPGMTNLEHF